ncbi:MAG: hypothetical protein WC330_06760 [Candidatus Omnitrophota bacterium]|jgi:hypothetical protein
MVGIILKKKVAIIVLCFAAIATCIVFRVCSEENSKASLKFSMMACGKDTAGVNPYSQPTQGILKESWLNDNKLVVECFVKTFCSGAKADGSYEIINDSIVLKYKITATGPVAQCNCVHRVIYEFSNLPKKNYSFIIEPEK